MKLNETKVHGYRHKTTEELVKAIDECTICARLLAEKYAGRSCNIIELYGTESSPSARARSKGFHQALKNYPQLHIIDTEYGNFDRVSAQKAMETALVKTSDSHQSVQAVFAHSDEDGLGALQAIKTAGLSPNDISIVSINGIQDVCKAIIAGEYLGTVESNPKWGFIVKDLINQKERGYTPFPTVLLLKQMPSAIFQLLINGMLKERRFYYYE